jgi:hypothetical protein
MVREFAFMGLLGAALVACGASAPAADGTQASAAVTSDAVMSDGGADAGGVCAWFGEALPNGGCAADGQFRTDAEIACTQQHGTVENFKADEKCGHGSSNQASWQCCGIKAPPPPKCVEIYFEAGQRCESDQELRIEAQDQCTAKGYTLNTYSPDEACGPGWSGSVSAECCR